MYSDSFGDGIAHHWGQLPPVGTDRTDSEGLAEHGRSEGAAPVSETEYQALFNSCNDAVFVYGLGEDGMATNFLQVNEIACERLGYARDELLQRSIRDIHAAGTRGSLDATVVRLLGGERFLQETEHVAR